MDFVPFGSPTSESEHLVYALGISHFMNFDDRHSPPTSIESGKKKKTQIPVSACFAASEWAYDLSSDFDVLVLYLESEVSDPKK